MGEAVIAEARAHVLSRFRWIDGDADIWGILHRPPALRAIIDALAALAATDNPDFIVGIESRGFLFAPAVAHALGVGFIAVRKDGSLFPGPLEKQQTEPDYRGRRHTLTMRSDQLSAGSRLVLVDDWVETGSQAAAVAQLARSGGAELVSLITIVDEADEAARRRLPPIRALVNAAELP